MKNIIIALVVIILVAVGAYFFMQDGGEDSNIPEVTEEENEEEVVEEGVTEEGEEVIGKSVRGTDIKAYHFGTGADEVMFVGGIHGGYSWNTALVAYELMNYLESNPEAIPENVQVTVIPVLNPDGLDKVVDAEGEFTKADITASQSVMNSARFNANNVDLNRNFDCQWQATGTWQNKPVSGGSAAFSEPETMAIRDYIQASDPKAVVVYYSAAGGVFASSCGGTILPETKALTDAYAKASGYKAYDQFNFYELTGDMVNWLAKNNIPGISVLLTDHQNTEWSKNQAGIKAVLDYYAK